MRQGSKNINVNIELTDHCNLSCIHCIQTLRKEKIHNKEKTFLAFNNWKKILNDLKLFNEPINIIPFWAGEPMLHPRFNEFIRYAFEQNNNNSSFNYFNININGTLLDKKTTQNILCCAGLSNQKKGTFERIHFSLDAVTPETFKKIKGVDLYNQTIQNIVYFIKERNRKKLDYPKISVALIVMDENKHEAEKFLNFWKSILPDAEVCYNWPTKRKDAIYFRKLNHEDYEHAQEIHKQTCFELNLITKEDLKNQISKECYITERDANIKGEAQPCADLRETITIDAYGNVTTCCFDINMENKLGNIHSENLYYLWNNRKINGWRKAQLKGDFKKSGPLCARCSFRSIGNLSSPKIQECKEKEALISYLKDIKKDMSLKKKKTDLIRKEFSVFIKKSKINAKEKGPLKKYLEKLIAKYEKEKGYLFDEFLKEQKLHETIKEGVDKILEKKQDQIREKDKIIKKLDEQIKEIHKQKNKEIQKLQQQIQQTHKQKNKEIKRQKTLNQKKKEGIKRLSKELEAAKKELRNTKKELTWRKEALESIYNSRLYKHLCKPVWDVHNKIIKKKK